MPPELELPLLSCCGAPTTPAADESSGGLGVKKTFERVHREIEGVPPKQLPAPASHELPSDSDNTDVSVNIDKESSA
jgi:hypothetical protein